MRNEAAYQSRIASLCLVLAAGTAALASTIFPVATTQDDEAFPTVSGQTVVWQFYSRYDDWDIKGADLSDTGVSLNFTITDFPADDVYPVIDGNDVVWQHHYRRNSDGDVYGADLTNRPVIARYAICATADEERLPCVSAGVVVWQHKLWDFPDWDIAQARLTRRDNPDSYYVSAQVDVNEIYPCISGSLAVWHQKMPNVPQPFVWGADISDVNNPRIFFTAMQLGNLEFPSLSAGWLAARETDDVGKVMVDNLFDPFNPEGISGSGLTACPKIHKHLVVWQDFSNGTWDIRGYNLVTHQEFAVTNLKTSEQINPAVYFDSVRKRATIVWQDDRNGNWDIYAAILDGPEVAADPNQ